MVEHVRAIYTSAGFDPAHPPGAGALAARLLDPMIIARIARRHHVNRAELAAALAWRIATEYIDGDPTLCVEALANELLVPDEALEHRADDDPDSLSESLCAPASVVRLRLEAVRGVPRSGPRAVND